MPYVIDMIKALQNISTMTVQEAKESGRSLRFHSIDFKGKSKLSEPTLDIKDPTLLADENAYQFQVSQRRGRIIGFVVNNIFYIKWFDPEHNLYYEKEGITSCPRGISDCDKRIEYKEQEIAEYLTLLDEVTQPTV